MGGSIQDRYRARFVETSNARRKKIEASLVAGDLPAMASELHTLSGEASLLSFARVADISRRASNAAREGTRGSLHAMLVELAEAIRAEERP